MNRWVKLKRSASCYVSKAIYIYIYRVSVCWMLLDVFGFVGDAQPSALWCTAHAVG